MNGNVGVDGVNGVCGSDGGVDNDGTALNMLTTT